MKVLDMTAMAISQGLIEEIGCALSELAISHYRNSLDEGGLPGDSALGIADWLLVFLSQ